MAKPHGTAQFSWMAWCLLLGAVMISVGCSGGPSWLGSGLEEQPVRYPQIIVLGNLGGQVSVSSPVMRKQGENQWMVDVPIRLNSQAKDPIDLEYKFDYFQESGQSMHTSNSDWQPMSLPPGTQRYMQGQAKISQPDHWRLTIRQGSEINRHIPK